MTTQRRFPGALVISVDFELLWGIRDHPHGEDLRSRLMGARAAVPRILELFEQFEIAATWATVGLLFVESRSELREVAPTLRPRYEDESLSPYAEEIGEDEEKDPLHFAGGLIERIRKTPRQEIATHTFSHYYCGEKGQDREAFQADLEVAKEVAARRGIDLRSIVFPRNQHNPDYDEVLLDQGITAFRGNPDSFAWRFADAAGSRAKLKRAMRLLDSYSTLAGPGTSSWASVLRPNGLANVCASYPLRPYLPHLRRFDSMRFRRIRKSLDHAAKRREILHLWWHPHNFGVHTAENLDFLRRILSAADRYRQEEGMLSLTMAEVGEMARSDGRGERV